MWTNFEMKNKEIAKLSLKNGETSKFLFHHIK